MFLVIVKQSTKAPTEPSMYVLSTDVVLYCRDTIVNRRAEKNLDCLEAFIYDLTASRGQIIPCSYSSANKPMLVLQFDWLKYLTRSATIVRVNHFFHCRHWEIVLTT